MQKISEETESISTDAADTGSVLTWNVHLLREEPRKLFLIGPIVVVSLLVGYAVFHSISSLAVIILLFLASLSDFVFPVRYEINSQGASARTPFSRTFIEWSRVRKYYVDAGGIKLSPLTHAGRLEAYRGVYLRFGGKRDEVTAAVRRMRDVVRTASRH
jgi:hypothetical protein